MEVNRTASTSRGAATDTLDRPKSTKSDIVAPSSPSKSKVLPQRQSQHGRFVGSHSTGFAEAEARREAELLRFADSRAKAMANHRADPDFRYPPGYSGDDSARGLLAQIKNRMEQRNSSSFLQKAKQVQQSLLDKQHRAQDVRKLREQVARRDTFRSSGFAHDPPVPAADQHHTAPDSTRISTPDAQRKSQGALSRASQRASSSDAESDQDVSAGDADYDQLLSSTNTVARDQDLALVETLQPGPRPIPPNLEDPKWLKMEPFSGHRLRERTTPHSQLKEHLRGRYHVPPSLLYSIARPITVAVTPDGRPEWNAKADGDYEVPVDGDFVIIATIVEKSELRTTKGFDNESSSSRDPSSARKTTSAFDDDPVLFRDASSHDDGKLQLNLEPGNSDAFQSASSIKGSSGWSRRDAKDGGVDEEMERKRQETRLATRPRKFVVLKLVDLGVNSIQGDGEGSAGRGDNYLSLIAFEADPIDPSVHLRNTNIRGEVSQVMSAMSSSSKKWVNGSRGAFELLYKQAEGTLVAIMNPKVLRPYTAGTKGSLETKMLRLTPRSAEDCLVIGQASDYRRCSAIKANGQRCANFVDIKARKQTRTTTCDYHLSRHMDELARGRPEFAANSTSRIGGAGGGSGSGAGASRSASSNFPGRKAGGHIDEDSAINKITTSYKRPGSNAFARAALSKKLNSSFATVGDGMENNGGQVYISQSPIVAPLGEDAEVRASDPSSWKYDISGRYGRGVTAKQTRLKKQIEEEQLMRKIEARLAPPPPTRPSNGGDAESETGDEDKGQKKNEGCALPILPNGSADMINAAYSTLEHRKRAAQQKKEAADAKRRKYTGVAVSDTNHHVSAAEAESTKLKFMSLTTSKRASANSLAGALPIAGLTRHTAEASPRTKSSNSDSQSKLLSLAHNASSASPISAEPNLKIKKAHRPRLRLPSNEVGRVSKLKVVGGELIHLDDFEDDSWQDDLDDHVKPTPQAQIGLTERIQNLQSQQRNHTGPDAEADDDSDLEII